MIDQAEEDVQKLKEKIALLQSLQSETDELAENIKVLQKKAIKQ